jgi:ectoine hydrolase
LEEYQSRLKKVRDSMSDRKLDALLIGDPANMNWLTGFDAWSFYVPQVMLVLHDHDPIWMGRKMEAGLFRFSGVSGISVPDNRRARRLSGTDHRHLAEICNHVLRQQRH